MKPIVLFITVTLLAGCGGAALQPSKIVSTAATKAQVPNGARRNDPGAFAGFKRAARHHDAHNSSISPEIRAHRSRVLFVSDFGNDDVYLFRLPNLKLLGTLTGFNGPQGECSDKLGHVWITNTYNYQILEYSHDGTLLKTLTDPTGLPVGCAWDKTTGNLAVTNIFDFGGSQPPGEVLIYPEASGTPTSYTAPGMYYYYFAGYDPQGNLFFNGQGGYPSYSYMLAELPQGASAGSTINLAGGTIYFPGMVQWVGGINGDLALGDQDCNAAPNGQACVYHASISGSNGTITGMTNLNNPQSVPACIVVQGVIQGEKLFGSDFATPCGYSTNTYSWLYPAGGNPTRTSTATEDEPDGTAISVP